MANSFTYVKHRPVIHQKKNGYEIVKINSDMLSQSLYGRGPRHTNKESILRPRPILQRKCSYGTDKGRAFVK